MTFRSDHTKRDKLLASDIYLDTRITLINYVYKYI